VGILKPNQSNGDRLNMSQHSTLSLSTKDVIHIEGFQENASLFKNESTLRIQTILQKLQTACSESGMGLAEVNALMQQGIPCEVLQPGAADWQVGRIRLSLEFQLGTAVSNETPIAGSVGLQSNAVVAAPRVYDRPEVIAASVSAASISTTAPAIGLENLEMPEAAAMLEMDDDFVFDSADLDSTDLDLGLDSGLDATNFGITDLDAGLMDDFMESEIDDAFGTEDLNTNLKSDLGMDQNLEIGMMDDLNDAFGEDLDLGELGEFDDLSEMIPDSGLEESVNTSLDLSDLSGMDELGDGLTDDLSFDLDSQAVGSADLNALDNPWDLNNDLDEMLLKNGVL
jgi:hypothetical protein